MKIHKTKLFGATVYSERPSVHGVTELPSDFVAAKGNKVLIAGEPPKDIIQLAFSELGMTRAEVSRYPRGERVTGLLVNLVA